MDLDGAQRQCRNALGNRRRDNRTFFGDGLAGFGVDDVFTQLLVG